ncbi:hypothetical protein BV25DRAFT_1861294 [Artomyces pyxidatus]|uniref:Uncharacterized protein n=1 Tax=Artomyces pyxidatus TaxID=48021 RepID=A0ACB8SQS8_9AGAM|nr:hypothetical protein BV25DRAFT_1861294 [Artomyces pyxidatus]
MAPAKRSGSIKNMKQGTLSFVSSKRTASGATSAKGKQQAPTKTLALSFDSPSSKVSVSSSNSSSTDGDEVQIGAVSRGLTRKRKASEVSRLHESIEQVEPLPPAKRLNTGDKRWNKAYGAARDKMSNLEPIHAESQTKVDHILRVFDLCYEYGPCVGVPRLERWERAAALGLNPPLEVREILSTKEGSEDRLAQSVFFNEV